MSLISFFLEMLLFFDLTFDCKVSYKKIRLLLAAVSINGS